MNSNLNSPPWVGTPVAGEAVDRLLYASRSCVQGSVFKEMHRIRAHALQRNMADDVCAALSYQAGWFMEWMEGPSAGIQAVMRRLERDPRHRDLRVVHHSRGPRRLPEPWSMAFRKDHEDPGDFERRVLALSENAGQQRLEPASVWRRLSMPLKGSGAAGRKESDLYQRVMVCSASGTQSFELVRWLGQAHRCKVTSQRLAGTQANDVANDYIDLDGGPGAMMRRVVAMARNGLHIGLFQAFLSDYSHLFELLQTHDITRA